MSEGTIAVVRSARGYDRLRRQLTASERKIANVGPGRLSLQRARETSRNWPSEDGRQCAHRSRASSARSAAAGLQDLQRQLIAELEGGQPLAARPEVERRSSVGHSRVSVAEYVARISAGDAGDDAKRLARRSSTSSPNSSPIPPATSSCSGGRVSDSIATFLSHPSAPDPAAASITWPTIRKFWPEHVLRMRKKDVVLLFDFRRYQLEPGAACRNDRREARRDDHRHHRQVDVARRPQRRPCRRIADRCRHGMGHRRRRHGPRRGADRARLEADWEATQKRINGWDGIRFAMPGYDQDMINGDVHET